MTMAIIYNNSGCRMGVCREARAIHRFGLPYSWRRTLLLQGVVPVPSVRRLIVCLGVIYKNRADSVWRILESANVL